MTKKKPKWGKPKLIVLVRGKPEERILDGCKAIGTDGGPTGVAAGCWTPWWPEACAPVGCLVSAAS